MSRLIDVDELFPNGVFHVNVNDPMKSLDELINRISNAPIAYDVEAVVRELEECEFCPAIIEGAYCDVENRDCTECFREKVIEIVRGGRNE